MLDLGGFTGLGNQGGSGEHTGGDQGPLGGQFVVAFDGGEMQATQPNGANQPAFHLIVERWKIG